MDNKAIETMLNHTSIRQFNQEAISESDRQLILDCALRGATAGNMMYYSVISIQDPVTLKALSQSCDEQPFIETAQFALLFLVDNYKWHRYFELNDAYDEDESSPKPKIADYMLGMQDAMIAAQNAVIAAESMGIGTCYIGDIMEKKQFHQNLFNLPDYVMPATLVVFGRFDNKPKLRPRFDKECVVFEEQYPTLSDEAIRGIFKEKEMKTENFAKTFYKRKMGAPFFKEMCQSIMSYLEKWV
jgi:nitroreductase